MRGVLGERHVQREVVTRLDQFVPRHLTHPPGQIAQLVVGDLAVLGRALREDHRHAEAQCAAGHGLADPTHARDPQGGPGDVLTDQQIGSDPRELPVPQVLGGLVGAPCGAEQEQHGGVRGGVVEDVRGVAHGDPVFGGRRDVDVVVPHRVIGDPTDRGAGQQVRVERVGDLRDHHVVLAAGHRLAQFVRAHAVPDDDAPRLLQDGRSRFRDLTGDQKTRCAHEQLSSGEEQAGWGGAGTWGAASSAGVIGTNPPREHETPRGRASCRAGLRFISSL